MVSHRYWVWWELKAKQIEPCWAWRGSLRWNRLCCIEPEMKQSVSWAGSLRRMRPLLIMPERASEQICNLMRYISHDAQWFACLWVETASSQAAWRAVAYESVLSLSWGERMLIWDFSFMHIGHYGHRYWECIQILIGELTSVYEVSFFISICLV